MPGPPIKDFSVPPPTLFPIGQPPRPQFVRQPPPLVHLPHSIPEHVMPVIRELVPFGSLLTSKLLCEKYISNFVSFHLN